MPTSSLGLYSINQVMILHPIDYTSHEQLLIPGSSQTSHVQFFEWFCLTKVQVTLYVPRVQQRVIFVACGL